MIKRYDKHIFICLNEREADHPRSSCGRCGGHEIRLRLLELIQQHNLKGTVRANKSLCLDACELGPAIVIYPEGIWYTQVKPADIDDIFEISVLNNGVVERLVATENTWKKLKHIRTKVDL